MFHWLRAQLSNLAGRKMRGLSLVAGYLANVLWLLESTWHSLITEGYGKNGVAYAALRLLSQSIPEARLRAYTGAEDDRAPLPHDHPLLQLIARPNPLMTEFELWELTTIQLAAVGRSVWWKERANGGGVLALWPLRPDRVGPIYSADPAKVIDGWAYVDPDGAPHAIPAADVVCFNFPDPDGESGGIVEGLGPLAAARADLSSDNLATQHTGALLANYAQPGIALKVQENVDETTANLLKAKFRQEFGGGRVGTPAILDAGAEIQVLGFSLKDLDFSALRADTESRLCAVLGVPSILVGVNSGLSASTYSNYESARLFFAETTLAFYWRRYADQMTHDLAPEFGEDITCEFDTSKVKALAAQREKEQAAWDKALAAGSLTVNEYRAKRGDPPLPPAVGDVLYVPNSVTVTPATEKGIAEKEKQAAEVQAQMAQKPAEEPEQPEEEQDEGAQGQEEGEEAQAGIGGKAVIGHNGHDAGSVIVVPLDDELLAALDGLKYNMFHDARGRFATSQGATSFTTQHGQRGTMGEEQGVEGPPKAAFPEANATGGKVRTINGKKVNTADMVNQAIREAAERPLDLAKAEASLRYLGHRDPAPELVADYARETAILARLGRLTESNTSGQIGKWDFSSAQTIHDSFNDYLDRRIQGQHARWTERSRGYRSGELDGKQNESGGDPEEITAAVETPA